MTRVVDHWTDPEGHNDTNPPRPPSQPIETAADVVAFGFKRFAMRIQWKADAWDEFGEYQITEVASVVDDDEELT